MLPKRKGKLFEAELQYDWPYITAFIHNNMTPQLLLLLLYSYCLLFCTQYEYKWKTGILCHEDDLLGGIKISLKSGPYFSASF